MRNIFIIMFGISISLGQSGYEIAKRLDEKDKPKNFLFLINLTPTFFFDLIKKVDK